MCGDKMAIFIFIISQGHAFLLIAKRVPNAEDIMDMRASHVVGGWMCCRAAIRRKCQSFWSSDSWRTGSVKLTRQVGDPLQTPSLTPHRGQFWTVGVWSNCSIDSILRADYYGGWVTPRQPRRVCCGYLLSRDRKQKAVFHSLRWMRREDRG